MRFVTQDLFDRFQCLCESLICVVFAPFHCFRRSVQTNFFLTFFQMLTPDVMLNTHFVNLFDGSVLITHGMKEDVEIP